jgi:hypothetical protein
VPAFFGETAVPAVSVVAAAAGTLAAGVIGAVTVAVELVPVSIGLRIAGGAGPIRDTTGACSAVAIVDVIASGI